MYWTKKKQQQMHIILYLFTYLEAETVEPDSTGSVLNKDAMLRPAEAITFHSMSVHDRCFCFLSLDTGI